MRLQPPDKRRVLLHGLRINSYTVGDWSPSSDGPASAVGLSLNVSLGDGDVDMTCDLVMRLKTPDAVDTMIQSLLRHKRSVWPDSQ
jgi:hypothetical protein